MTEIEIDHNPKIFDDPEYCNLYLITCRFLSIDNECNLFKYDCELRLQFRAVKCDQCKDAYKKAKQKQQKQICQKCGNLVENCTGENGECSVVRG